MHPARHETPPRKAGRSPAASLKTPRAQPRLAQVLQDRQRRLTLAEIAALRVWDRNKNR